MTAIFDTDDMSNLRGPGAYKLTNDFDTTRRGGGGRPAPLTPRPLAEVDSETDRALARSRELLNQLRQFVAAR